MTTSPFMDSSAKLRSVLERRREKAASEEALKRIPFILDQDLADAVRQVAELHGAAEDHLADLEAYRAELEASGEESVGDVRASGHDMSDLGQRIEAARAEVNRLHGELEHATEKAREGIVQLVFRRVDAEDYERLLIKAGGGLVDTDAQAAIVFHDSLVAACFVRVEIDGEDGGYTAWRDFVKDAGLSFGEVDPIRSLIYAMNRRGGNSVPF